MYKRYFFVPSSTTRLLCRRLYHNTHEYRSLFVSFDRKKKKEKRSVLRSVFFFFSTKNHEIADERRIVADKADGRDENAIKPFRFGRFPRFDSRAEPPKLTPEQLNACYEETDSHRGHGEKVTLTADHRARTRVSSSIELACAFRVRSVNRRLSLIRFSACTGILKKFLAACTRR